MANIAQNGLKSLNIAQNGLKSLKMAQHRSTSLNIAQHRSQSHGVRKYLGGELDSPVVEWLNKGLMAVSCPTRGGDESGQPLYKPRSRRPKMPSTSTQQSTVVDGRH
eukprot:4121040-Pyramimonas_sp.AAC.1